jgi:hypothetical protein
MKSEQVSKSTISSWFNDSYDSIKSINKTNYIYYSIVYSGIAFGLFLFGAIPCLSLLGFPIPYAEMFLYSTAATLSYLFIFGFCDGNDSGARHKGKINFIFLLSYTAASTVIFYHMSAFTVSLIIPAPIVYGLVSLLVCKFGSASHDYNSNYSPVIISLLLPITCALPGLYHGNTLLYLSFIAAYYISNLVKMPLMKYFDNDLQVLNSLYTIASGEIKISDINSHDQLIFEVNKLLEQEIVYKGANVQKRSIAELVANKLAIKKIVNKLETGTKLKSHLVSLANKNNSSNDYGIGLGSSDSVADLNSTYNDWDLLSPGFKEWISNNEVSYDLVEVFDFVDTRPYTLLQNKSQNFFDLMTALIMLLLGSIISNFCVASYIASPISFVVCFTSVYAVINLVSFYINRTANGLHVNSNYNQNDCQWFGIAYSRGAEDEVNNSFYFNVYFVSVCLSFIVFVMQYTLFDMYLMRFEYFIPWVNFLPQIILFGLSVLFSLSFLSDSQVVSADTMIFVFAVILFGGVALNFTCPSLLFLFSQSPVLANYAFMSAAAVVLSNVANNLIYSDKTTSFHLSSNVSSLSISPQGSPDNKDSFAKRSASPMRCRRPSSQDGFTPINIKADST